MRIAAIGGTTLLDFPGRVACILFTQGCTYDCFYCHNRPLVSDLRPLGPEPSALQFLQKRVGLLEGVVVSGGEPTMHHDLDTFLAEVKQLGYAVKLDTNGSNPAMLEILLEADLVDYVAIDVKAPWERYEEICGKRARWQAVADSLALLRSTQAGWEVRTTVCPSLTEADMQAIASQVGTVPLWRWNVYRIPRGYKQEDEKLIHLPAPDREILRSWIERIRCLQPHCVLPV